MKRGLAINFDKFAVSLILSFLNTARDRCANCRSHFANFAKTSYLPSLNVDQQFVYDADQNFDMLRFGLQEWKKVAPYLLKEFYTLTPWHKEKDNTDFTAFCYYDPEKEDGVIFAFRQEKCSRDVLNISLPFIDSDDRYIITDEDSHEETATNGTVTLQFDGPRTAKLLWVKKI